MADHFGRRLVLAAMAWTSVFTAVTAFTAFTFTPDLWQALHFSRNGLSLRLPRRFPRARPLVPIRGA